MESLVKEGLQKTQSLEDKSASDIEVVRELNQVLLIIFSRPNNDNMVSKLIPDVRKELNNYRAFYDSIHTLVDSALLGVQQNIPPSHKSTYLFVLENIMSELKPEIKTQTECKKIFYQISNAKIKISDDLRLDRKIRSMFQSHSPSDTAHTVLKQNFPDEFKEKKKSLWERIFG